MSIRSPSMLYWAYTLLLRCVYMATLLISMHDGSISTDSGEVKEEFNESNGGGGGGVSQLV